MRFIYLLEEPRGCDSPVVVFDVEVGGVGKLELVGYVVDTEAVGGGNLEMVDELETEADIPGNLARLRLHGVDDILVELEGEVGAGEEEGDDIVGDNREVELILDVDGEHDEILARGAAADFLEGTVGVGHDSVGGGIVHSGVHEGDVEREADDGDVGLGHDAGFPTGGVGLGEEVFGEVFGEMERVDVEAGFNAEGEDFSLSAGGCDEHGGDDEDESLEGFHKVFS